MNPQQWMTNLSICCPCSLHLRKGFMRREPADLGQSSQIPERRVKTKH